MAPSGTLPATAKCMFPCRVAKPFTHGSTGDFDFYRGTMGVLLYRCCAELVINKTQLLKRVPDTALTFQTCIFPVVKYRRRRYNNSH